MSVGPSCLKASTAFASCPLLPSVVDLGVESPQEQGPGIHLTILSNPSLMTLSLTSWQLCEYSTCGASISMPIMQGHRTAVSLPTWSLFESKSD